MRTIFAVERYGRVSVRMHCLRREDHSQKGFWPSLLRPDSNFFASTPEIV